MARGKKKDAAPAAPAPEITAPTPEAPEAPETTAAPQEPEAHLDPGHLADMDDDTLQQLAMDIGLDPAAHEGRDALIAAIAAKPLTMDPTDPTDPEEPAPTPEPTAGPEPEQQQDPAPATTDPEDPEPDPAGERHTPYKATVAVSLAVLHKSVGVGTADMLKAVGTLRQGTEVTVTGRKGTYAQLKNGLYILEAFLEVRPIS